MILVKDFKRKIVCLGAWPDCGNLGLEARSPRLSILVKDFKRKLYVWGAWPDYGNLGLEGRSLGLEAQTFKKQRIA